MTITRPAGGTAHDDTPALGQAAQHRVSVVIPTLNEALNLEHVFAALPAGLHEVIVVDGHSTDGTPAVARQLLPGRPGRHADQAGQGQRARLRVRRRDRRHHRDDRRRRLDRPGRDPELRRGADSTAPTSRRARASLRGGGSSDITRLRWLGNRALEHGRQRRCSAPATPTSATATTPSGAGTSRSSASPRSPGAGARLGRWLRDRDAAQPAGGRGRAGHRRGAELRAPPDPRASNLKTFRDGQRVLRTIVAERWHA